MTTLAEARSRLAALRAFYRGAKGEPALPARLLQPLFNLLSVETRLWLVQEPCVGMLAASVTAKEWWGADGTAIVDGDELQVGLGTGETFVALGRGSTWKAAFEDAAARGMAPVRFMDARTTQGNEETHDDD